MATERYTIEQKKRILERYMVSDSAEKGVMLREYRINSGDIHNWKHQVGIPTRKRAKNDLAEKIINHLVREEYMNEGLIDADLSLARQEIAAIISEHRRAEARRVEKAQAEAVASVEQEVA